MNEESRPVRRLPNDNTAPSISERSVGELALALQDVADYLRRYIVLSDAQVTAIALWAFHTHAFGAAEATPYLDVSSPEKESGKSLLFEVLELLVARAVKVSSTTAAALARAVSTDPPPTLLLDESDNTFKRDREYVATLLGVLNDGYRRGGRTMLCLPPRWEVSFLPVFAPKALAGIGALPDTLTSRSIPIRMKRKTRGEHVHKFRRREAEAAAEPVYLSISGLAESHVERLADARPATPDDLRDRAADVWEPLFAIADLAGGDWPHRARQAALELSAAADLDEASIGVHLLGDIRSFFIEDKAFCADVCMTLNGLEVSPWGGWNEGKGITTRELGHKLRPYGIRAKTIRIDGARGNGYEREQFEDAWSRYLPTTPNENRDTVTTGSQSQKTAESNRDNEGFVTVSKNGANPHEQRDVTVVTVLGDGTEREESDFDPVQDELDGDGHHFISDEDYEYYRQKLFVEAGGDVS